MAQPQIAYKNQVQVDNQRAAVQRPNFAYSFRPIYLVSRIFGLMPFSIAYYPNGDIDKPKIGIVDGLWFAISLCVYIFGIYKASDYTGYNETNTRMCLVSAIGFTICFELGLVFGCLSIVFDMGNRFKLIDIIREFTIYDQEASVTG